MSDTIVSRELFEVRSYLEEVGTAATAMPGSVAYYGLPVSKLELDRVVSVTCRARGAVEVLTALWSHLQHPGMLNLLRRRLLCGPILRELSLLRAQLDAVRVGHHPRWEAPHV